MDIEIKINHFGPLNNITLHWAPFMVLTGHSNLGKSYANYLIYYAMSGILCNHFDELLKQKLPEEDDKASAVLTLSEIENYLKQNYEMQDISEDMLEIFGGSIGKAEQLPSSP